jgi:hypothetical protein
MKRREFVEAFAVVGGATLIPTVHAQPAYDPNGAIGPGKLLVLEETPRGRIIVVDSVTYGAGSLRGDDVMIAASYAGASSLLFPLMRGVKAVVAHEAGVGKDNAGISGLQLCQGFAVPAAAVETMSAGLSLGGSMIGGIVSHVNEAAAALGVRRGQTAAAAARAMLAGPAGVPRKVEGAVDLRVYEVARTGKGRVIATASTFSIKEPMPDAVICGASHTARVFAESLQKIGPRGAMANDAGFAKFNSGIDGLPILDQMGIAGAAVAATSARIGDGLSTYNDGVISAINSLAASRGVKVGMPAKEAAALMLG